jgi:(E)-4-hydroxy-3-methyl-but-2-enyl pyrophosphate reductase
MIYIPNTCGTCKGAIKALGLIYEVYEKELISNNPKKIYIYKQILHNNKVVEELNNLGIEIIDDLSKVTDRDIVIIRAHGESKEIYDYLTSHNIEFYDATCPNVLKIHKLVNEKYNDGYEIIIVGDKDHAEVIGTNGWCNNEAIIIDDEYDFKNISDNKNKLIVSQTTFNKARYADLCKKIALLYDSYNVEILDSYCASVERICESSEKIAKKCDLMIVVGDKNSSNTMELFNKMNNITKTYRFNEINDFYKFIMANNIDSSMDIGITGGASTPIKEIYNYKYLLSFICFYKDRLKELASGQDTINNRLISENDNEIISDVIKDFIDLNKDGKYIRGTLIALGKLLSSDNTANYLNLAYAYEMFQTSVLIHDDIIDNSRIRRGKMTIPRRICNKYLNKKSNSEYHEDTLRLANSIAICAGDLGFYEANKLLIEKYKNNKNLKDILELFNDIVIKTIKGEILDVYLPYKSKYDKYNTKDNDVLTIYNLKTSWYTIVGPFALGYLLGGKKISKDLKDVLDMIGVIYQIKDDILGIFANEYTLGKSNYSDIEEFKQTILYSYIINTDYKNEFLSIYGKKNINNNDILKIRELLIKSGSLDNANNIISDLEYKCLENLDNMEISDSVKDILKGLLIYLNIREK